MKGLKNTIKTVRQLLCMVAILITMSGFAQHKCLAVIDWKHSGAVELYAKADGKIVETVKNDSANEDFLHLEILDQTDAYFKVSVSSIKVSTRQGWIKKAEYIGAYKRQEKFPMDLILFKHPTISEADKIIIRNWTPGLLTISSCAGAWTFVSLKQNEIKYEGWIKTIELCANAYTYCN